MLRPGSIIARTVALALLAIVLLAGYQLVLQPLILAYAGANEQIARSNELLQRYRILASEKVALSERLTALKADDEIFSGYLEGPSDALAAAQLQDLAAQAIETAGGEVTSTQILEAAAVEDGPPSVRRIGLKLRFNAGIDGLASTLHDLETTEPRLLVDQLVVVSNRGRRSDRLAGGSNLDVRLDLFGYVRQPD